MIEEIERVLEAHPFIKYLHFDDDILPINKKWFREFAETYRTKIALPFECNIHPNLVNETTLELLKTAGCKTIRIGLESGNAYIRKKILNRRLSEDTIVKASSLCKEAGIRLYSFNMVGLPSEDMKARLDTIKLNATIDSDEEQVSIFYPYENTRLFDICKEHGLIRSNDVADLFKDTFLSFDRVTKNQVVFAAYFFTVLVRAYKILLRYPKPISRIMIRILDSVICSRIIALTIYPSLIASIRYMHKNEVMERCARKIKHRFFRRK